MKKILLTGLVSLTIINGWAQLSRKISTWGDHSLMIKCDSTLTGWGRDYNGAMGTSGDTTGMIRLPASHGGRYSAIQPIPVGSGINKVIKVAAGGAFSLALRADGTVWSWGMGALGDSTGRTIGRNYPKRINALSNVVDIAAASDHALALLSDGSVWGWGYNNKGQLGAKTYSINNNLPNAFGAVPVKTANITNAIAISAGEWYSVALLADSSVVVWGSNAYGQLALPDSVDHRFNPVSIDTLHSIIAIDAGRNHVLALAADGTIWAWGHNYWGQLGNDMAPIQDGSPDIQRFPSQVMGLTNVISVAAGQGHSLALLKSGILMSWGGNYYGELGLGTHGYQQGNETIVQYEKKPKPVPLSGVVEIEAGYYSSSAVLCDGSILNWGWNTLGTLGNGNYSKIIEGPFNALRPLLQDKPGAMSATLMGCTTPIDTIVILDLPKDTALQVSLTTCTAGYAWKQPIVAPCVKVDSTHHASGETFAPGVTTVNYAFSNHLGDTVFHSFTVTVMPLLPIAGFEQQFNNQSISFMDTSSFANAWMWDFGDGNSSTEQNPAHAYTADGIYDVCLIAKNGCTADTVCHKATIISTDLVNSPARNGKFSTHYNATGSSIVVEGNLHQNQSFLSIVSGNGQLIADRIPFSHKTTFDCSSFAAGVYIVRITDGQGELMHTQKLSILK